MSETIDLKIPLQAPSIIPRRCWPEAMGDRPRPISKALPVYYSLRGTRAHRVRYGHLYPPKRGNWPRGSRLVFTLWCGQHGTIGNPWGRLVPVPPAVLPMCGTCEGRAVGAGYPGIAILQTRYDLIYSPREGRAPLPASEVSA